ncbi:MAG TPA: hypothetical protein P5531_12515 [Bacteroidales bacterium]|nr:hypothetical protein [Bacteroidales bacterium]HSA44336.1 hypothetical protein [Bacteroidales bacterium]
MQKKFTCLLLVIVAAFLVTPETELFAGSPSKKQSGQPATVQIAGESGAFLETLNTMKKRKKKRKKGKGSSKGGGATFDRGVSVISLGYGFPNLNKSLFNAYKSFGDFKVEGSGPFHAKFEYGINESLGIGLSINTVNAKTTWTDSYEEFDTVSFQYVTYNYSKGFDYFSLAANIRMNYHFFTNENLDVYVGLGLGYNFAKSEFFADWEDAPDLTLKSILPLGFEITGGMRYYFSENFGLYLESGLAKSVIQGGLSIKF